MNTILQIITSNETILFLQCNYKRKAYWKGGRWTPICWANSGTSMKKIVIFSKITSRMDHFFPMYKITTGDISMDLICYSHHFVQNYNHITPSHHVICLDMNSIISCSGRTINIKGSNNVYKPMKNGYKSRLRFPSRTFTFNLYLLNSRTKLVGNVIMLMCT